MVVGIYTEDLCHLTENHAYLISSNKDSKILIIIPFRMRPEGGEHPWCLKRLMKYNSNIQVVSFDSKPKKLDWLYVYTKRKKSLFSKSLNRWAWNAENRGLISRFCYQGIPDWKDVVWEYICSLPYSLFAKVVEIPSFFQDKNIFLFIRNKFVHTPFVHPHYFLDGDLSKRIFSPIQETSSFRVYKFSFMGNKEPLERSLVLEKVFREIEKIKNIIIINQFTSEVSGNYKGRTLALWIAYDYKDFSSSLAPAKYIDAMEISDFSICPRGHGGNWTHRVVESLLRGAIPILADPEQYNVGLEDMKNCIVVKNEMWAEAIERADKLCIHEIIEMRKNIISLRNNFLLPDILAARLRKNMLLENT